MICYVETISTTVYHKVTNTDIYTNWKSFTPINWRWGTLKTLVRRAFDVCSSDYYLDCDLQHLKKVFYKQNDYPLWVISKVFKEFQSRQNETTLVAIGNEKQNNKMKIFLILTLITLILMLILMHIISSTQK